MPLIWILVWLTTAAYAGVGVQLPPGEDSASWTPAFEFAGLQHNSPGMEPQIRVEVTAGKWVLRASDGHGTVRTAEVDIPTTDRAREEVALVAGGLIRALAAASAPTHELPRHPPPPPPPPPPIRPDPPPRSGPPGPRPPAEQSASHSVLSDYGGPVDRLDPPAQARPPPMILDLDSPEEVLRNRRDQRVVMAPFTMGAGIALRPGAGPGVMGTLGSQLTRLGKWSVDLNLSGQGQASVDLEGANPAYNSLDVDVLAVYRANRYLSAGPLGGLTYRTFFQDQAILEEVTLPKAGAFAKVTLISTRWFAVRSVTKLNLDVGTVRLQAATESRRTFSFFGAQTGITLVFGNEVDPFLPKKTLRKR